jgi:hypothetical protein
VDEENIKKQVEEEFREMLKYKESEIQSMNIKIDRIS